MRDRSAWFRVWAPEARTVELVAARRGQAEGAARGEAFPLSANPDGTFSATICGLRAGDRYWYRLDGGQFLPDPASRFQPEGVHGPSELIDPSLYRWSDAAWPGLREGRLVIYELHVGAFTEEGTFAGVESRLDHLVSLGVSAVELMPIAEFPGRWNWGYDGVDLFAPCHQYGTPDDLRRLVDAAHRRGLGVILDVVYNHLGPDGAYLGAFSPYYFTSRHKSPWGDGVNLDGPHSEQVRHFFIENALHWVHEYHVDGLRLDATHALQDDSREHFLCELAQRVEEGAGHRPVVLIAEDERNLDRLVRPRGRDVGGYGLTAVWSDDFHHQLRRLLAGDCEGYYTSFSGTTEDLATTIRRGWFFVGQRAPHTGRRRGTDPSGIPLHRFVVCLQNHDQVGNRAHGDRLNEVIDLAAYRAASALLLFVPETPLLFMGQEWASSSPFLYFTDHGDELGRAVTEGRRAEFAAFSAFCDPASRKRIPDPQAASTFERSRLRWDEREAVPHRGVMRLYREMLQLRIREPHPGASGVHETCDSTALDLDTVAVMRPIEGRGALLLVARLRDRGPIQLPSGDPYGGPWRTILTTEDPSFTENGCQPRVEMLDNGLRIDFRGPAAVVLAR